MALSGQVTVTTAGQAVQGPDVTGNLFLLAPHPDNTDDIWVGNDEASSPDVTSSNGFPLKSGGSPIMVSVVNLNRLWFDADVNGEKACWLVVHE